ncbi:hypothetical protein AGDE_13427 [Angomonas deanei]|uniref:Uncharacterized protein n=1 Tax=Angomonas deanei TaxID=59799 RepID=A0A7G2C8X1_9TRYP|nr:hypothetical protein AGDE_13427 [Angomonas deanei]CAD2216260.1 hypothetical protein, conserved [Angomonas deanei]|eukprot:EPY22353.1 hypothetical protein AGDE_13427 [Angomonas deanei]
MSLYAFVKQLDNSLLKKVAFYMNLKRDIFLLPTADSDSEDLFLQLKGEVVALLTVQETKVGQKHFSLLPDDELSLEEGGSVLMEAARDVWRGEDRVKSKFNHLRVYSDDDELDTAVSPVEQVANLIHSYMSCTEGRRKKTVDTKALCDKQTEAKAEEQKTPENLNQLTKNVSEQAAQLMKRIVAVQASTNFSSVRHQEEFASFACDFLEISAAAQRILDQSIIEELTTPEKNPPTTTKVLQNVSYSLSPTRLNHSLSPKVPGRPPNQYRRSISLTQAATSASESQQTSFQRSATQQHYGAADPSSDPPQKDVFERLYPAPRSPGESPKLPAKTAKPTFRLYV